MAAKKIKDAAVVVREYQDRNGQPKKQWSTVGSLIQFDDGGTVLMLDKSFNPAGVPGEACRISFFDPKPPGGSAPTKEVSDDLPF
jgi:hypothetical protein